MGASQITKIRLSEDLRTIRQTGRVIVATSAGIGAMWRNCRGSEEALSGRPVNERKTYAGSCRRSCRGRHRTSGNTGVAKRKNSTLVLDCLQLKAVGGRLLQLRSAFQNKKVLPNSPTSMPLADN